MTTMLQRLWWAGVAAALGVAWLAAGYPGTVESAAEDGPVASTDSVLVKHELVHAGVVSEIPPPPVVKRARVAPPAPRRADAAAEARPAITARAMRILIGDGRYRPQPFPTVK